MLAVDYTKKILDEKRKAALALAKMEQDRAEWYRGNVDRIIKFIYNDVKSYGSLGYSVMEHSDGFRIVVSTIGCVYVTVCHSEDQDRNSQWTIRYKHINGFDRTDESYYLMYNQGSTLSFSEAFGNFMGEVLKQYQ